MISAFFSRLVIIVFGLLYPAYASYKAVRTKNVKEYVKWMMYWIVFALFMCAEVITDIFLSFWFPFYYEIKIMLLLWLLSPATKGSSILYRKFVHPMLSRREQEIDEYIAKAKEQSYHTVLHLGTKGVNYATTVIMQTAIKGGGGLVQQLRRSYSLGDLSSDVDGAGGGGRKTLPDSQDRPRERERAATTSDGRQLRPRGHSPRRSASGSGRVEMYFPEVDVDVRGSSVREPSVPLSQIRSSEDVSSGYSSAEPLYQQSPGGQGIVGRPDALASSREPLVRTASVGGSTRSARTRASRGAAAAAVSKRSTTSTVTEAGEVDSPDGEDSSNPCSSPRSRSNSLPVSADLLRPELVALLQALNAELVQKVSQSKLAEPSENLSNADDTDIAYCDAESVIEIRGADDSSIVSEDPGAKEISSTNVSEHYESEMLTSNIALDSDDTFYDSVSSTNPTVPTEFISEDVKENVATFSDTVKNSEVNESDFGTITVGSLTIPVLQNVNNKDPNVIHTNKEKQSTNSLNAPIGFPENSLSNADETTSSSSQTGVTNEINLRNGNSSVSIDSAHHSAESNVVPAVIDDSCSTVPIVDGTTAHNEELAPLESSDHTDSVQKTDSVPADYIISDKSRDSSNPVSTIQKSEELIDLVAISNITSAGCEENKDLEIVQPVPLVPAVDETVQKLPEILSDECTSSPVSALSTSESHESRMVPKKDVRSGKYNKLQAPEPPPRSGKSSARSSMSEEGEASSEQRSRSPRKVIETTAAKLHGQIESLAAMLPFWQNGKRPPAAGDGGFRIREMSRSPSRRSRGQPST